MVVFDIDIFTIFGEIEKCERGAASSSAHPVDDPAGSPSHPVDDPEHLVDDPVEVDERARSRTPLMIRHPGTTSIQALDLNPVRPRMPMPQRPPPSSSKPDSQALKRMAP